MLDPHSASLHKTVLVLTLVDKSGSSKRVAPKAPPRRTIRNSTAQYAGSYSDDTASQNLSFPGTPDPQAAGENVVAAFSTQKETYHNEPGADPSPNFDNHEANESVSETPIKITAASAPTTAGPRAPKAPLVISSIVQPPPSSSSEPTQPHGPAEDGAGAAKTAQSGEVGGQSRTNKRSSRATSRNGTGGGAETGDRAGDEVTTTPRRRTKAVQKALNGTTTVAINGESVGVPASQALGHDISDGQNLQVPGKQSSLSRPRRFSTRNNEVIGHPQTSEDPGSQANAPVPVTSRPTRKQKQKKTVEEVADEVIAEASGRGNSSRGQARGKKRKHTLGSEEAENHEIVPTEVKMGDLVRDRGLGKGSKREAELQKIDWAEVKQKRREAQEEAVREEKRQKESRKNGRPLPAAAPHATERLVLVNGQMVIDESSRVIDRNAATARDAEQIGEAINEDRLTKRVNQATIGRKPGALRTYSIWDDEETEQFYQGLRMFGTDFMMISKMFPDTSRAVIKKKYNKEEKLNPEKVIQALNSKEPIDLQALSEMTNTVYEDPNDFYKELEEQQARLEAEDAEMRAEEAEAGQELHQSIEQGEEGEATEGEQQPTGKNRFDAEARSIMGGADSQKKKGKKTPGAKKKAGKKGKGVPAEGTEEMVGSIVDFNP